MTDEQTTVIEGTDNNASQVQTSEQQSTVNTDTESNSEKKGLIKDLQKERAKIQELKQLIESKENESKTLEELKT